MLVYLLRQHFGRDRLASGVDVSEAVEILLSGRDATVRSSGDVDVLDDATCRSWHGDIGEEILLLEHNVRRREREHAKRAARPFLAGFSLAELCCAFPALHRLDGANDVYDVNAKPMDLTAEERPKDLKDRWRLSLGLLDWDLDWRAHDGDFGDDDACISSRWHLLHFWARKCDNLLPTPCPSHLKMRSYKWSRPSPPLEGCLARPLWGGRAPS